MLQAVAQRPVFDRAAGEIGVQGLNPFVRTRLAAAGAGGLGLGHSGLRRRLRWLDAVVRFLGRGGLANLFPEAKSAGRWLLHGWHVPVGYVAGFFALILDWRPNDVQKVSQIDPPWPIHALTLIGSGAISL